MSILYGDSFAVCELHSTYKLNALLHWVILMMENIFKRSKTHLIYSPKYS